VPKAAATACPECGTDLGKVDPYKHAVGCFHLPDKGAAAVLRLLSDRKDAYADRVRAILEPLGKEGG